MLTLKETGMLMNKKCVKDQVVHFHKNLVVLKSHPDLYKLYILCLTL
jgi:hypothetical protein